MICAKIAIYEATNKTILLPPLYKAKEIAKEIIALPRGYIYGNTIYRKSGSEQGYRKGELFHADNHWAIVMEGYMNIEIYNAIEVNGYSWRDVELVNHEWCLDDKAESAVYAPGDYVFGLVPRGDKGWRVTVKEVLDTNPAITEHTITEHIKIFKLPPTSSN